MEATADNAIVVLTTAPDEQTANRLAKLIIEKSMAACVNISASMTSVYSWKGEFQQGKEHQLTIKTTQSRYAELQQLIVDQHPYELPEILALPIVAGLPAYLDWVNECTKN